VDNQCTMFEEHYSQVSLFDSAKLDGLHPIFSGIWYPAHVYSRCVWHCSIQSALFYQRRFETHPGVYFTAKSLQWNSRCLPRH